MDETTTVVDALIDAVRRNDLVTAQQLVAPNVRFVFDAGTPFAADLSLEEFVAGGGRADVTEIGREQPTPDTIVRTVQVSGGAVPNLPHPFTQRSTVRVNYGRVAGFVGETDPQTLRDLADLMKQQAAQAAAQAAANVVAGAAGAAAQAAGGSNDPLAAARQV